MESILSLLTNSQTEIAIIKKEDFELNRHFNSRKNRKSKGEKKVTHNLLENEVKITDVTTKQQIFEEPANPSLLFFVTNPKATCRTSKPAEKNYECKECGKQFTRQMYLISHSLKHTNQRSFQCSNCKHAFKHKASLSLHMKIHLSNNLNNSDKNQKKEKLNVKFICQKCSKNFKTKQSYEAHCFMHNGERPYKCSSCPKSFLYKHALNKHILNHIQVKKEKKYKCEKCEKCYEFKSELIRHFAHHSDERSWLCTICGKRYPLQATLKTHLKTHSPGKAYECDLCKSTFMKKSVLEMHVKKIHNKESPGFMCDRCPKQFYSSDGLKQHMIIHLNDKRFKCDVCFKYFLTKSRFLIHKQKIHGL